MDVMTTPFSATVLDGRVAIVTGGVGFLGRAHATALREAGARVALFDIHPDTASIAATLDPSGAIRGWTVDITNEEAIRAAVQSVQEAFGRLDILVNNAANNPKTGGEGALAHNGRVETFPLALWEKDLEVGVTAAFLMCKVIGPLFAAQRSGVIVNIASDLSVIAPDHRIYVADGMDPNQAPKKPASYSVVKHALVGLTKYLATYWADEGVRVNAISPGGIWQPTVDPAFVKRLTQLIPLGRMATPEDVTRTLVFLCSDASAYMTGQNVVIDGGRSVW